MGGNCSHRGAETKANSAVQCTAAVKQQEREHTQRKALCSSDCTHKPVAPTRHTATGSTYIDLIINNSEEDSTKKRNRKNTQIAVTRRFCAVTNPQEIATGLSDEFARRKNSNSAGRGQRIIRTPTVVEFGSMAKKTHKKLHPRTIVARTMLMSTLILLCAYHLLWNQLAVLKDPNILHIWKGADPAVSFLQQPRLTELELVTLQYYARAAGIVRLCDNLHNMPPVQLLQRNIWSGVVEEAPCLYQSWPGMHILLKISLASVMRCLEIRLYRYVYDLLNFR